MIRIREILLPENVLLDLPAGSREEGIQKVAESLKADTRILDWEQFYRDLLERDECAKVNLQFGVTLPHTRTDAVTRMVMAFGRLARPVQNSDELIQFILMFGIPKTMDAEYLRLVGVLMRVFRSEESRRDLLTAEKPSKILGAFERAETQFEHQG
jgi:mannitol/fructose-specific phosphotransferase system IIA component (Ntr-type)